MEGGLCEAHSPGIRSPGPACKLFHLQPLSRGPRAGLRGLGASAGCTQPPQAWFPDTPHLQPESIWPEPWAAQTLLEKDSGRSRDPEPRGWAGGTGSGEVGRQGVLSPTQRQPPSPSNPSFAWSPLHFPGRATGLADLQAAPLPEVCAGEGRSLLLVVSAGSAAVGAWEKHFQGGVCVPAAAGKLSGRSGRGPGFPPPPPHGRQGLPQGAEAGFPAPVSQNPAPCPFCPTPLDTQEGPGSRGRRVHVTPGVSMEGLTKNPGVMSPD